MLTHSERRRVFCRELQFELQIVRGEGRGRALCLNRTGFKRSSIKDLQGRVM